MNQETVSSSLFVFCNPADMPNPAPVLDLVRFT